MRTIRRGKIEDEFARLMDGTGVYYSADWEHIAEEPDTGTPSGVEVDLYDVEVEDWNTGERRSANLSRAQWANLTALAEERCFEQYEMENDNDE
jgi:hypothetical protein